MLIQRHAFSIVQSALNRQAAVALIGPRQVGKTTLARMIGEQRNALYLDLEDREDRTKLASPRLYLERFEDRLVILDEDVYKRQLLCGFKFGYAGIEIGKEFFEFFDDTNLLSDRSKRYLCTV